MTFNFFDYVSEEIEDVADNIELDEALKIKYVVRNGKKVKKWKTDRQEKYRVEYDVNGKPREVRITNKERRKRRMGQIKGKLKRKAKDGLIQKKREHSFKQRKNMGLDYNKKIPDKNVARDLNGNQNTKLKKDDKLHPKDS